MLRRALRWLDSTNQEVIMTLNENAAIVLAALGRCALPHQFAIAGGYARDLGWVVPVTTETALPPSLES